MVSTMGMNKAQKLAAARAKELEVERTAVGSDNPQAIQERMDAVTAQPLATPAVEQPKAEEVKAPAAPTTPTAAPAISKQMLTVLKLTVELREKRQIEVTPQMVSQDGKYILINIGELWPTFRIGAN
jgi:hypothetical protein